MTIRKDPEETPVGQGVFWGGRAETQSKEGRRGNHFWSGSGGLRLGRADKEKAGGDDMGLGGGGGRRVRAR